MGDSLTWCKDLWTPKTFNRFSFAANVGWIAIGIILFGVFMDMEINESRFDFRCNAKIDKDFIQGKCFVQYERRYYKLSIPLYGFVIVNFFLPMVVSVIYSQFAKSRIHELEASNADVERQQNQTARKLFTTYCCQLAIRWLLGILFIVFLQTEVAYPRNFPSNFKCNLMREDNHATNATWNTQAQSYECNNQRAHKKSSWVDGVKVVNGILALVLLIEIFNILSRARKEKKFMEDWKFFNDHLKSNSDPPQELQNKQISQQIPLPTQQEQIPLQVLQDERNQETSEELQQNSDPLQAFLKSHKDSVIERTKRLKDLKSLFRRKQGEGSRKLKDLELDQIYTNLVICDGRAGCHFTGDRQEKLKAYPKPEANLPLKRLEDLIADINDVRCKKILVIGRPGIGKTLFCTKLLQDWASESTEMSFDVAFLLKFRRLNKSTPDLLNLRKLLDCSESSTPLNDVAWDYICKNPNKVLLIFDGIDESSAKTKIAEDNDSDYKTEAEEEMPLHALYNKIALGKLLPGATVLTTTRPTAGSYIEHLEFDRTVEILGFTSEQVNEYVKKFTEDDNGAGETIWQHISSNLNLFSLCYIPVSCFIICSCLLKILKNDPTLTLNSKLPTKLTRIYSYATNQFYIRHSDRYPPTNSQGTTPKSCDDLPDDVEKERDFKQLGHISFKGIKEQRLIFGSKEVENLEGCGLIYELPDLEPPEERQYEEPKAQFCFMHVTIQEFLAAKHITDTMNDAELREFVADHINDDAWRVVLQFVAGLLQSGRKEQLIDIFIEFLPVGTWDWLVETAVEQNVIYDELCEYLGSRTLTYWPTAGFDRNLVLTLSHCLYEIDAKDSVIQNKLREIGFNVVDLTCIGLQPVDCQAIVNLLENHKGMLSIDLSMNNIGPLGCKQIRQLFTSCKLSSINLSYNQITNEGIKHLDEALKDSNCKLSSLDLSFNKITNEGIKHLAEALKDSNCKLSSLNLSYNKITDEGIKHLAEALKDSNCKLSSLDLSYNKITNEGIKHLAEALKDSNCKLSSLNLSRNKITNEGIKHLAEALKDSNCKLSSLDLSYNKITNEGIKHLAEALKDSNCKLSSLNLSDNEITNEGIKHLAEALKDSNCKLSSLNLSDNEITNESIKHLAEALKDSNCKLSCLNLSDNEITNEGIKHLAEALKDSNCKLSCLDLSFIEITNEGIKHLAEALKDSNCKLSSINLSDIKITDEGIKHLAEAFKDSNCKVSC